MITEKKFLEALEIVRKYRNQTTKKIPLKKGDTIKITKTSGLTDLVQVGKEYRVVSYELRPKKYFDFQEYLESKYGKPYSDLSEDIYNSELENYPNYARVKIDLGGCHYKEFNTSAGYEYVVLQ